MIRPRFRNIRTLDVQYLWGMQQDGRLVLRPDFQRNAVWPTAAKSYLIDTIIRGLPTPLIFTYRMALPDTGQSGVVIVDGQQRLAAIFEFLEGRYRLSGPDVQRYKGMDFKRLPQEAQSAVLAYGLVVEELDDLTLTEIRDVFARLNKYGVRLSPQELRHAREEGAFKKTVERVGRWPDWTDLRIISSTKAKRMRADEFAAELLILLSEAAPQDKKAAIDQYYVAFAGSFPGSATLVRRLRDYVNWTRVAIPRGQRSQFRKAVDFYSLIGALDKVSFQGERLGDVDPRTAGSRLTGFSKEMAEPPLSARAAKYLIAASRQTDNIVPRTTRIDVLAEVLREAQT